MPIEFDCPVCKNAVRVPDGSQGKRTRCPKCQAVMQIPGPQEETFAASPESPSQRNEPWGDSQNPFGSPAAPQAPWGSRDLKRNAKERLAVPVIGGLTLTALGLVSMFVVYGIIGALLLIPDLDFEIDEFELITQLVSAVVSVLMMIVTLIGLNSARKLENYGLAWVGFILAAIPCTSFCCFVSLPLAIWGMVVLADEDVKRAFKN